MKILHVISSLNPAHGGPVENIKKFCKYYANHGSIGEIVCSDNPKDKWLKNKNLPKIYALGPKKFKYSFNIKLLQWLYKNSNDYDILIINGVWQFHSLAVWLASKKNKTPYFVFPHGMLDPYFNKKGFFHLLKKKIYWNLIESKVLNESESVLFTSKIEKKLADKNFKSHNDKGMVLGYGVEGIPKDYNNNKDSFLKKNKLKKHTYILYIGRFHKKKGIDLLIKSYAKIVKLNQTFKLVLTGPQNEYLKKDLFNLIKENDLNDKVIITGPLYENFKWQLIKNCSVLCLTSHQENFGLVIAEALSCSKPVLITNQVNIHHKINYYKAGFVCEDNLIGVTRMMKKYIDINSRNYNLMCKQAKKCFDDNYKIGKIVYKLLSLLKNLKKIN